MTLLLIQMFPSLLTFVALFRIFTDLGDVIPQFGLNTSIGLILAYLGGAMGGNVWLLKGYFDTVPKELDEAAKVDGASHARVFFTITLPLITPILVTVGMIQFIGLFNEDVYKRQPADRHVQHRQAPAGPHRGLHRGRGQGR